MDLGIITAEDSQKSVNGILEVALPSGVRIGGMDLDYSGVRSLVIINQFWFFKATHADANLPSKVLMRFDVVFDYPGKELILSKPGKMKFSGIRIPASVNPESGIVQIDGVLDKNKISFALDNGASYTFGSTEFLTSLLNKHPELPICNGAVGYANIWGWGLSEDQWKEVRAPELVFGNLTLMNIGITIPPDFNEEGIGMMDWYSRRTVRPVDGFLGPNAFIDYALGIDYSKGAVYFAGEEQSTFHDMDMIGLTLRTEEDGNYRVIGVATKNGIPVVNGIESGDMLLEIDDVSVKGKTMGIVIDALRGKPGTKHDLLLKRNGNKIKITADVIRIL
jgi:hypothetical protein